MKRYIIWFVLSVVIIAVGSVGYFVYLDKLGTSKIKEVGLGAKRNIGIGVVIGPTEAVDKYQVLVDYLNKYSDDSWSLVPLQNNGSLITQLEAGQIQAGFVGSMVGFRMMIDGIALPVVRAEKNGISHYSGYIITRKDSGLNTFDDLQGKRFAFVDQYTSSGYLFPLSLVRDKGTVPENYFKTVNFVGTHEKAIRDVLDGEYDGASVKDTVWKQMAAADPRLTQEVQVIAQKGLFPDRNFMINKNLGDREVEELRHILQGLTTTQEGKVVLQKIGFDRFITTTIEDFGVVKEITN